MAIKFAQKTSDTKTPAAADKASLNEKSAEKTELPADIDVNEPADGTDLFENKSGTQKRKKKR